MATLDEIYRKFGEASEAAQLLEIELGNILIEEECFDAGLLEYRGPEEDFDLERAGEIFFRVSRKTLGELLKSLSPIRGSIENLEQLLIDAKDSRNRLTHRFYLEHNLRRNSDDGRDVMLRDLETIHETLLEAYKAVMRRYEIDLEEVSDMPLPTGHLPIRT